MLPDLEAGNTIPSSESVEAPSAEYSIDHLGLRGDVAFNRFLTSLDYTDEAVLYSNRAVILSPIYTEGPEPLNSRQEPISVCITNYRLLIFPDLVHDHIIFNVLDQFALEDILMVSLPYQISSPTAAPESIYALRTQDVAVHLISLGTLWIRVAMYGRSELVEALHEAHGDLIGTQLDIEQINYPDLITQICSGHLHKQLREIRMRRWATQPLLITGSLNYQAISLDEKLSMPTVIDLSRFTEKVCALSRHAIHMFDRRQDIEAYRFILSVAPGHRANIPEWVEIDLTDALMSTFKVDCPKSENSSGIQIRPSGRQLHLMMPTMLDPNPSQTLNEWLSAIKDRDLRFLRKVLGDSGNGLDRHVHLRYDSVELSRNATSVGKEPTPSDTNKDTTRDSDRSLKVFEDVPLDD